LDWSQLYSSHSCLSLLDLKFGKNTKEKGGEPTMGRKANPLSSRAKLDLISPCPFVKISPSQNNKVFFYSQFYLLS